MDIYVVWAGSLGNQSSVWLHWLRYFFYINIISFMQSIMTPVYPILFTIIYIYTYTYIYIYVPIRFLESSARDGVLWIHPDKEPPFWWFVVFFFDIYVHHHIEVHQKCITSRFYVFYVTHPNLYFLQIAAPYLFCYFGQFCRDNNCCLHKPPSFYDVAPPNEKLVS